MTSSPEDVNKENAPVGPGVGNNVFNQSIFQGTKEKYNAAVAMLGEVTLNGYKRVSDAIKKQFCIPDEWMPSYYNLTKHRPAMELVTIKPSLDTSINHHSPKDHESTADLREELADVGLDVDESYLDINDTLLGTQTQQLLFVEGKAVDASSFIEKNVSMTHYMEQMKLSRSRARMKFRALQ